MPGHAIGLAGFPAKDTRRVTDVFVVKRVPYTSSSPMPLISTGPLLASMTSVELPGTVTPPAQISTGLDEAVHVVTPEGSDPHDAVTALAGIPVDPKSIAKTRAPMTAKTRRFDPNI